MLKNYLKIAWRNLIKNKVFSFINIAGLAIGLSCFLLITLYVMDELSFDKYNDKADRIYRINSRFGGAEQQMPLTSDMMGGLLKKDYPQIEQYTRIYTFNGNKLVKKGNEYNDEKRVAHVDSTFFDVFTLPAIEGDTKTALNEPNTVVITESTAKKYFASTHALGKTIETKNGNNTTLYKITAIIKDIPQNSHFHFDFLFSMKNADYKYWGGLLSHNFHTYLLLKKGTDYKSFDKIFSAYINKYVIPEAKTGNKIVYSLMPLTKIHLYSGDSFELSSGGNIQYVYIFSAVALFIVIIACINFMNLTTARSINRAREVGIRKVLGTEKSELIRQFLFESTLMVLLSLVIAIAIVYSMLPLFNDIANKQMTLQSLFSPYILPLLIALPFAVGLLSGGYPAFYLSAFRPAEVLKGKLTPGNKSGGIRSILVVFQFATSIILIIGTIVVYRQLNYIQTKNLGFNKNQVLIINNTSTLGNRVDAFKDEVLQIPGIVTGTISAYLPVSNSGRGSDSYSKEPEMDPMNGFGMQSWTIDYDYIKTMGMKIVKGRNFSKEFGSDSNAIVINETTEKILGYPDPVGQKIYTKNRSGMVSYNIIGVVKNFNYETLHQEVGALAFFLGKSNYLTSFKVNTSDIKKLIPQIENKWKALASGIPFSYHFLDESFNEMYNGEQRVGKIALIFSVLAIFIACLGLYGLATFIAYQRTKEIGIRKVLGASARGIVQMLSKDFIKLVTIAFIIATPVSWYFMNTWLQDFAYRIELNWWMFAAAGAGTLVITLLTVSFQAIRAAMANPVKSLRTE